MFKFIIRLSKEVFVLFKYVRLIKYIYTVNPEDSGRFGMEERRLNRPPDPVRVTGILTSLMKPKDPTYIKEGDIFRSSDVVMGEQDELWFFINGIKTDERVLNINLKGLSKLLNRPITGIYNPTEGVYRDLCEAMIGRSSDKIQSIAKVMAAYLTMPIMDGKTIKIIAHSQGGIILSNVAKVLLKANLDLSKVEFFTIAGAQDEFPDGVVVEHFGNMKDYVFRVGAKHYEKYNAGPMFTRDATGHLMNMHYLEGIYRGEYCSGQSNLYRYIHLDKVDKEPVES